MRCLTCGKVCPQPVAGKAMGLPGGRGSPIERRDRDRDQGACPTRGPRLGRVAASTASPPTRARAAARNPSEAMRQPMVSLRNLAIGRRGRAGARQPRQGPALDGPGPTRTFALLGIQALWTADSGSDEAVDHQVGVNQTTAAPLVDRRALAFLRDVRLIRG
jgi:hypothetical protein